MPFKCINCGHLNKIEAQAYDIPVSRLEREDIGSRFAMRNHPIGILLGFGKGTGESWGDDVLFHVDVKDPTADTMRELGSFRAYFRSDDTITIWR